MNSSFPLTDLELCPEADVGAVRVGVVPDVEHVARGLDGGGPVPAVDADQPGVRGAPVPNLHPFSLAARGGVQVELLEQVGDLNAR